MYRGYIKNTKNQKKSIKRWIFIPIAALLLIAGIVSALELTNTTHFFHKEPPRAEDTGGQYTKGQTTHENKPSSKSSQSSSPTPTPQPGDDKHKGITADTNLIAPTGTFANIYTASVDDQMGSTCNTTPGATCQIIFKQGTVTKSLSAQAADKGGAVYWSWKPKDIGLTSGTWHITATAILNGQAKTTNNDPLTLKIQ